MANAKPYNGTKNLIPATKETAKALGSNGGKKSGQAHRVRQTFKELAQMILERKPSDETLEKIQEIDPEIKEEEATNRLTMLYAQVERANKGDTKAFESIRDTAGEKPVDKAESKVETIVVHLDESSVKKAGFEIAELMDSIRNDRKD